jgi:hypothetical protein
VTGLVAILTLVLKLPPASALYRGSVVIKITMNSSFTINKQIHMQLFTVRFWYSNWRKSELQVYKPTIEPLTA